MVPALLVYRLDVRLQAALRPEGARAVRARVLSVAEFWEENGFTELAGVGEHD